MHGNTNIKWIGVLDWAANPVQLLVKEALHIQKIPANNRLNHNRGYELPGY